MTNAWGPLGSPTREQVAEWRALPYGRFRIFSRAAKKSPLKTFVVTVTMSTTTSSKATLEVTSTDKLMLTRDFESVAKLSELTFGPETTSSPRVSYSWVEKR